MARAPLATSVLVTGLLLATSLPAAAQPATTTVIVVAEPAVIGIDPNTATTFADLLRDGLSRTPGYMVVPRGATPTVPCGEPACGVTLAREVRANEAVTVTLSQLGTKVIVRVAVVNAAGNVRFSDRVSAQGVEDLDPLSKRVSSSIVTGKPIGESVTVSTVTTEEGKIPMRRKSMATWGLRIGGGLPFGSSYGGANGLFDFGAFGMFELSKVALMLEVDGRWSPDDSDATVSAFNFDFGIRYFPTEDDTGFYVGGGLGFRAIHVDASGDDFSLDTRTGLGGYAGGGVVFLRTADIHVVVNARYDFNFFKTPDVDGNLHALILTLGISFAKLRWW